MADDDGERGHWFKKLKTSSSSSSKVENFDYNINKCLSVDRFNYIHLNTDKPNYENGYNFASAVGEYHSRSETLPVFHLTPHSLYTAMVTKNMDTMDIITGLTNLSEDTLSQCTLELIHQSSDSGKIKLVLKKNRYYVESESRKVLKTLLKEEVVSMAQINLKDSQNVLQCFRDEDGDAIHFFEIDPSQVENVKQCLRDKLNYFMLEEYDFSMNFVNPELSIQMKPQARQRPYQKECERKIFINGRARSGLIVLPFHAGKSFIGVSAVCKIQKSCLCLVSNAASVDQWALQFRLWSTIEDKKISLITSDSKQNFHGVTGVVVTTYEMINDFGKETAYKDYEKIIGDILKKEWGLLLLDEVDDVPEQVFRKVISITKSHCKLGLAATLVRNDKKFKDWKFLIGPKLYEANRLELVKEGFIPDIQCFEVQCTMTDKFCSEYVKAENSEKKQALYVMNPNKFRACEFLIRAHRREGNRIIVFGDDLFALTAYANKLQMPMICGATSRDEKTSILEDFKFGLKNQTIFLSKIGYESIDILEADVIIQISAHTEFPHRLGRVLKTKELPQEKTYPFFYSLVSMETQEVARSVASHQFFIVQGYKFEKITGSSCTDSNSNFSSDLEIEFLNQVLYAKDDMVVLEQQKVRKTTGGSQYLWRRVGRVRKSDL